MKVVLFCGGFGMRLREYSERIPKPLAEIGSRPLMWHLMKYYAHYGHKDFILCLGHGGSLIKEYFLKYDECISNNFVLSQGGRKIELLQRDIEDWRITMVDTGLNANLGQRLWRVKEHLAGEEVFMANYADGVTDLDLDAYVKAFTERGKTACFLSVRVPQSFHCVEAEPDGTALKLVEVGKSSVRVNGGFFCLRQEIFDYMRPGEELVVEPFQRLIEKRELTAVPFEGFWQSMDTFKDKIRMDELAASGNAPWEVWKK